jgi:hypothetical protein
MPLSEQEQRLLEEMERSLYHNDADFVAAVSARGGKPTYTAVITGILVGVVGVAALITGVVIRQPIVGVLGFVAMFAGVLIALTPPRGARMSGSPEGGQHDKGSFLHNLEHRWDKNSDEGGE